MSHICRKALIAALAIVLIGCASGGGYSGSGSSSRQRAETAGEQAAKINIQLAVGYLESGKLEFAQEKIERALEQAPGSVDAHTVAAVLNEQIGSWKKAERHYRRAVRLAPDDGSTNNNLGTYLCKKGEIEESVDYFETAVNDPFYKTPAVAFVNAGNCVSKVPDLKRAERYYRGALELRPGFADALFQMMNVMYQQGQYLKARGFLQRLEQTKDHDHTSRSLLMAIRIEEELGDAASVRSYQDQLRNRFPDSEERRNIDGSTRK